MAERYFYVDQWTDEVMPCAATLEAWAEWLSKPDVDWNRMVAADDGDTFGVSTINLLADITATHADGEWIFSPEAPQEADFFYCRYGPGLGWDAEMSGATLSEALAEADLDEAVTIACTVAGPSEVYRFNVGDPPSLTQVGAVQ